jgi:hypothetical protein
MKWTLLNTILFPAISQTYDSKKKIIFLCVVSDKLGELPKMSKIDYPYRLSN